MADKQTGSGDRGKQKKVKGQGHNETGNDTRTSSNNRSRQIKERNRSTEKKPDNNDRA